MVSRSIWQDTYYTTTKDVLTYYIQDDEGNTLFAGKAYKMPNEELLKIKINQLCRNYLGNDIRPLINQYYEDGTNSAPSTMGVGTFYLYDGEANTQLEIYKFLYDWSYTMKWNGNNGISLSYPINRRLPNAMFPVCSRIQGDDIYNFLFEGDYLEIEGCDIRYGIYYLNSYGGWDAFVFEGKCEKEDNITQFTTDRSFDNSTLDFEQYRYVSEISTTYILHTGWLNDEQSNNLCKNLIGSNLVYLQDMVDSDIIPVVITNTNVKYQTMKNNGGKMITYEVVLKSSQSKLRQ